MDRILKDFISLFFPRICINCGKPLTSNEQYICLHCKLDLPIANFHEAKDNPLNQRLNSIEGLNHAFAFLKYTKGGVAQKLLHKLKYEGEENIGYKLGLWMGYEIGEFVGDIDLIIPVPLHRKKLKKRGYNQSDSICKGLGEALGVLCDYENVIRTKHNSTQTKKTKIGRWLNVEHLFEVNDKSNLLGKNILIVDDVITTGATISSMTKPLVDSEVKSISVACIASGK